MARTSPSGHKNSSRALETFSGAKPTTTAAAPLVPTTGQRVFLWVMTVLLAGWFLLLALLAWWSSG